jgi:hypothetical protein
MPASRTTLPHLAISERMAALNSSGELPTGSKPCASSRSRKSGCARILTMSPCRRPIAPAGVRAGDHVLSQRFAEALGEHAPQDIRAAARRKGDDHAERLFRIALGARRGCHEGEQPRGQGPGG